MWLKRAENRSGRKGRSLGSVPVPWFARTCRAGIGGWSDGAAAMQAKLEVVTENCPVIQTFRAGAAHLRLVRHVFGRGHDRTIMSSALRPETAAARAGEPTKAAGCPCAGSGNLEGLITRACLPVSVYGSQEFPRSESLGGSKPQDQTGSTVSRQIFRSMRIHLLRRLSETQVALTRRPCLTCSTSECLAAISSV